jgi:hypothetical protein
MFNPEEFIAAGEAIRVDLRDGRSVSGHLVGADGHWLGLETDDGRLLLPVAGIAAVCADQVRLGLAEKPRRKAAGAAPAVGRGWNDADLRQLADAFLDGEHDAQLAERFGRSRSVIKILHAAFECARGNLVEEDLPDAAKAWLGRWSAVLTR